MKRFNFQRLLLHLYISTYFPIRVRQCLESKIEIIANKENILLTTASEIEQQLLS